MRPVLLSLLVAEYNKARLRAQNRKITEAKAVGRNEVVAALQALEDTDDPDDAHYMADAILLALIDDPEITDAFRKISKWYA